jgi:hypothetical protein
MRLNFILFTLLLLSFNAQSQKVTGIWRGYFSSSNGVYREGSREETYKYEIQIDQQTNNGLKGVTYSYKTTVFYGKAELQGIYTAASKSLIIKEIKLVDLKIGDKSEPCLMTCYLDYSKIGKLEVLEGTFISINVKDKSDCGSGKVYLERVPTSDFKKEDFLTKKKPDDTIKSKPLSVTPEKAKPFIKPGTTAQTKKDNLATKPIPLKPSASKQQKPLANAVQKAPGVTEKKPDQKQAINPRTLTPATKKPADKTITSKSNTPFVKDEKNIVALKPEQRVEEEQVNPKKKDGGETQQTEMTTKKIAIPKVLVERENNLVQTVITHEENIVVELYDIGVIDNDTISVYHNNQLVVSNGRLTYSPITIKIKCSKTDNHHEIIVVAENLGDIPPNTALMIIKSGNIRERHEIPLVSTEQRNAKVIINYVPKE